MRHVLAYQEPNTTELKKYDIPPGYEEKVNTALIQGGGVKIKGGFLAADDICGIFTEAEYESLVASGVTVASKKPKTWDDLRGQEWYLKSKAASRQRR